MQSIVNMTQVDITGNLHLRHFTIKTNIVFLEDGNGDAVFAAASVSSFQQSETTHMSSHACLTFQSLQAT